MEIPPDYKGNSLYNIGCSLAHSLGIQRECEALSGLSLPKDKTILILLDGLGRGTLSYALPDFKDFRTVTSTFPSTTSTAITTLFTATLPGTHRVLGYNTFSKELGGIINTLRYTFPQVRGQDIFKSFRSFSDIFRVKSYLREASISKKVRVVLPVELVNTEFSNAVYGQDVYSPYMYYWDSFFIASKVIEESQPDFLHIYLPDIDSESHLYGSQSEPVLESTRTILSKVFAFAEKYMSRYNLLITADHGHITTDRINYLDVDGELLGLLEVPPYGDSRAVMFRTRYDLEPYIAEKYPGLEIFRYEELQDKGIFPKERAEWAPDQIGVPCSREAFIYRMRGDTEQVRLKSHHGGMSAEEMQIPLIQF